MAACRFPETWLCGHPLRGAHPSRLGTSMGDGSGQARNVEKHHLALRSEELLRAALGRGLCRRLPIERPASRRKARRLCLLKPEAQRLQIAQVRHRDRLVAFLERTESPLSGNERIATHVSSEGRYRPSSPERLSQLSTSVVCRQSADDDNPDDGGQEAMSSAQLMP